jgi:hypothetical protein
VNSSLFECYAIGMARAIGTVRHQNGG